MKLNSSAILTHLKLLGSLLKVISSCLRNLFMPVSSDCGEHAVVSIDGVPSNTITRSAKYLQTKVQFVKHR